MKEQYKCKSCGEDKPVNEMTGNYHCCKQCSTVKKYRYCRRCKTKQPPENFEAHSFICSACKQAEQIIKQQRKAEYETRLNARRRGNEQCCAKCNEWKPLGDYYTNKKSPDGRTCYCKDCWYQPKRGRFPDYSMYDPALLRMAESKWNGIEKRCSSYWQEQHACYRGVENRLNREEFIRWVIPKLKEFHKRFPYEVASVDRVDPTGHYELNNMRILSHYENSLRNRGNPHFAGEETLKTVIGPKRQPKGFNGLPPDWLNQFKG